VPQLLLRLEAGISIVLLNPKREIRLLLVVLNKVTPQLFSLAENEEVVIGKLTHVNEHLTAAEQL
jgi:hypothetical protein